MNEKILIVDDEPDIIGMLESFLSDEGYLTYSAQNAQDAQIQINREIPSLAIIDIWMRDSSMDGISLLNWIKDLYPEVPIIMISGHGTVELAVNAIKSGAYDFIEKPFKSEKLILMIKRALENIKLKQQNAELKQFSRISDKLIGNSSLINSLRQTIGKVAQTNSRVLITGPSGSGKETCARSIHILSQRSDKAFINVNCSMLNEEIIYGSDKNKNSTGSVIGILEKANRGTIFLDEICELPNEIQSKLVHTIQQQRFRRIGGNFEISVDVRVISSSSKNIKEEILSGRLREDLYYRLSVVPLTMPSLKDYSQDIPDLIEYYMKTSSLALNKKPKVLNKEAIISLQNYSWPGNQNQLRNVVDWILIMTSDKDNNIVTPEMLPPEINLINDKNNVNHNNNFLNYDLKIARENFEKDYIMSQISRFNGNISRTANFIGMERSALHRKLKNLGIKSDKNIFIS